MSAGELLALLRSDISMDDVPQSGCVDDAMLAQLLDRSWMLSGDEHQQDRSWMLTAEQRLQQQQQSEAASAGSSEAEGSESGSKSSKAAKGRGGRRASRSAAPAAAAEAAGSSGQAQQAVAGLPYAASGVGYEVVQAIGDSGLLSNVN
jgi:hypothetical protein